MGGSRNGYDTCECLDLETYSGNVTLNSCMTMNGRKVVRLLLESCWIETEFEISHPVSQLPNSHLRSSYWMRMGDGQMGHAGMVWGYIWVRGLR